MPVHLGHPVATTLWDSSSWLNVAFISGSLRNTTSDKFLKGTLGQWFLAALILITSYELIVAITEPVVPLLGDLLLVILSLRSCPISWKCMKQHTISRSSFEDEYHFALMLIVVN